MIVAVMLIFIFVILAQPSTAIAPLTADEMLGYPDKKECATVTITRFEALRSVHPDAVIVVFDGVLCDGDEITF